ncbi:MAG: TolC family protein [Bacteroidales bacterium]|jgi:outer membrane protein TolC|nr:TolC family protein [Bacteroidales bacterium]
MMKKIFFSILICGFAVSLQGQLTLEYCHERAKANYPLIKQYDLIEQSKKYNIAQINKSYIPQLSLNGKVTWQSDVTEFPEEFSDMLEQMNVSIDFPGQDQYNFALELRQTIWDGGATGTQKKIINSQNEIEKYNLEVNMYALTDQINQLYFSILLIDEQMRQNTLLKQELERNYNLVSTYIKNGVAQQSDLDEIKVEMLSAEQRDTEMKTSKKTFKKMLSAFIAEEITDNIVLEKPKAELSISETINRPELKLYDSQIQLYETRSKQLWSNGMPRIALFAQGAYGNPGLNMFESGFTPYFIGGVQLSWNFGGLYTNNDEKKTFNLQKQQTEVQREVFLFNLKQKLVQQDSEIEKLQNLLENDDEIIRLREDIQKTAEVKVENGTMNVNDLLQYINTTSIARQNKAYHEIQLLMAIWQRQSIVNN